MKKIIPVVICLSITFSTQAQTVEDAKLYSWYPQNGTARILAVGGAMGSLGGDISATFVNPAGLGFYRTRDIVVSPQFSFLQNSADFRGTHTSLNRNMITLGPSGYVSGIGPNTRGRKSVALAIAFTQTANLNNYISYTGLNNYSSYAERFAEEFAKSGLSIDEVLNTNSSIPYTVAPALYTYLIDTVRVNGDLQIRAATENLLDAGNALKQQFSKETKGGIYELGIGAAVNTNDKWLFGGTLGLPIVNVNTTTTAIETDTSSSTSNGFKSFSYTDHYKVIGGGVNLKLGVIFRPREYIRIGLALHSPSFIFTSEEHSSSLSTQLESPSGAAENYSVSSNTFTNGKPGEADYRISNPWKAILSASYVLREIADVSKQKGFITADIEFLNYGASRFGTYTSTVAPDAKQYYKDLNQVVKDYYKSALNFRVGGELKFNTIMTRLGFAYYGNPYKDNALKAGKTLLSAGLGYRDKGFFADLTYIYNLSKDNDFPYLLQDRQNTFSQLKTTGGSMAATIGFKF